MRARRGRCALGARQPDMSFPHPRDRPFRRGSRGKPQLGRENVRWEGLCGEDWKPPDRQGLAWAKFRQENSRPRAVIHPPNVIM